jgi:hypothetical protein
MTAPTFVARTPTDLVALVPLVLGFHPHDSVVLMTFGEPGRSFHARVDLPDDDAGRDAVTAMLLDAVQRNRVRRAAVVLYTDHADLADAQAGVLRTALEAAGVDVIEALRVADGRWFPVPDVGSPGTAYDLETHAFTAEHVLAGRVVRRDRDELAASLATLPAAEREDVAEAAIRAEVDLEDVDVPLHEHARWLQRCLRRHLGAAPPGADDTGRLLVLASVVETRDVAWAEITRETSGDHVELWRHVLRHAPRALVPGVASLMAFAAWQHGDGALAWCALDRVEEVDPEYSMARGIADLLAGAVPPDAWRSIAEHELPVFAEEGMRVRDSPGPFPRAC